MQHFDLVIIGAGSGNTMLTPFFDDWKVAIVERDLFGGTCMNRGCIPSKMFVYAADVAEIARRGPRLGVETRFTGADWPAIRDRVFDRIDPIAVAGEEYRLSSPNVTVFKSTGRFIGHKRLAVGDDIITGDHIVIAAGSRARMPIADGFDSCALSHLRHDHAPRRATRTSAHHGWRVHRERDGAHLRFARQPRHDRASLPHPPTQRRRRHRHALHRDLPAPLRGVDLDTGAVGARDRRRDRARNLGRRRSPSCAATACSSPSVASPTATSWR